MFARQLAKLRKFIPGYEPSLTAKEFSELLGQVNSIRTCMGIGEGKLSELPSGTVGDEEHCVLARALGEGWEPTVDGEWISLRYPNDPSKIDWPKLLTGLRRRGYDAELFGTDEDGEWWSEEDWKTEVDYWKSVGDPAPTIVFDGVRFPATRLMSDFIRAYDDQEFPWLIVGEEDRWEHEVKNGNTYGAERHLNAW